ncbi:hypothetical protein TUM4637_06620 [Shewanella hafniensis]|nr:hypothetical protein TUM4637_06620 [Shewanella hafniensis]
MANDSLKPYLFILIRRLAEEIYRLHKLTVIGFVNHFGAPVTILALCVLDIN